MNIKCLICNKEFTTEELRKKHEEEHLKESILNKPKEDSIDILFQNKNQEINLKKFFSEKKFEKLVESKINSINEVREIIKKRDFVEQIKEIIVKTPFVYVPYFVNDFLAGNSSKDLLKKYHISNPVELKNIVKDILQFNSDRYRSQFYSNALELNLKIHGWSKNYDIINENCEFFNNEIQELFFENVIRAYIILFMMDHTNSGIEKESIISKCNSIKNNYDIFYFIDETLAKSFDKLFDSNFSSRVSEILSELIQENIITRNKKNPKLLVGTLSIDKIKGDIINDLKINSGKLSQGSLRTSVMLQNSGLKLVPGFGQWHTALGELESENQIHIDYKNSQKWSNLIYLNEDYEEFQQKISSINNQSLKFHGRTISPETFVLELLELKQGDFDDDDDQVTRLAGLVLAESIKLQSTPENISEFDFSVNIKNYDFKPEQLEAMSKAEFKLISEIIHFKVMINETITLEKYEIIKTKLPQNEQCGIFNFEKIPGNVQQKLVQDPSIQIIDEEGVKLWVSITSKIPARKNSIARLHYDPLSKLDSKIVRINSINYENSIATVSILPDMKEASVLIGTLEEISFFAENTKEYEIRNSNYFDFLKKLHSCSPDNFETGLHNTKVIEVKQSITHSTYDGTKKLKNSWRVQLEDIVVNIDLREKYYTKIFNCDCLHQINQEHSYTFCKHVVAALNAIALEGNYLDKSWNSWSNKLHNSLKIFAESSVESSMYALLNNLDDDGKNLFENYLESYLEI